MEATGEDHQPKLRLFDQLELQLEETVAAAGRSYLGRIGTKTIPIAITATKYKLDVNTRDQIAASTLGLKSSFKRSETCYHLVYRPFGCGEVNNANIVEQQLHKAERRTMLLDGDNLRHGLNRDLGFTETDRVENIRRVGEVAKLMIGAGLIVLCSFISPYRAERDMVRRLVEPEQNSSKCLWTRR